MKRIPGTHAEDSRRNFSGLSSTSTIEAPISDPVAPMSDGPLRQDAAAPNQAFATSALHSHTPGDEKGADQYESVDYRRLGAFGTPGPIGGARAGRAPMTMAGDMNGGQRTVAGAI